MKELQAIVRTLARGVEGAAVLATLVSVAGSSYRRPGARLLVGKDFRLGSISGGCLEEDVLARARRVAASGAPEAVVYDTTSENDLVWGVGLGCHGVVRVLIEKLPNRPTWATALAENFRARQPSTLAVTHDGAGSLGTALVAGDARTSATVFVESISPPVHLSVFGAGDDARPLVRLGKELGWMVTVADPRPAFATAERFPEADRLIVDGADALAERAALDARSVAVVMTHHYVHDVPILGRVLRSPAAYIGLLGPRKRAEKILADLSATGLALDPARRARLHAPVGLDLGADGPEQVALAVVAEIQASLTGRDGAPLRLREAPIHDPA